MYIITATFDADAAFARTAELLALGDSPERLAERLGITRELGVVKQGVQQANFRRVFADLKGIKKYVEVRQKIEDVRGNKSVLRFLGEGMKGKQLAKLEAEMAQCGSLIDAPAWFYQQ